MAKAADRFRAYATIRVDRPVKNEAGKVIGMAEADASGDVFLFADLPANGVAKFDAGDTKIRRVAFYSGPVDSEVCVGSVEVNASGKITADVADIPEE